MLGKNKIYGFCLTMVIALELLLGGCGGADAEPASVTEIATAPVSEPAADTGNSVEAPLTDQDSLEFDDIPEIVGYEVTDQNPMGKELYVTLQGETTEEKAIEDFTNWAAGDGWTTLDAEWPNVDLVFEKSGRVYPLKISVFPQPSSGGVKVLVIMPAAGEKLGNW